MYGNGGCHSMEEQLLEEFTRQYIEAQTMQEVLFTWHGGEPLLMPRAFYEKALQLQRQYACGRQIDNCIQTNGTLLTDDWCRFLKDNNFLVGISIDGPQHLHDHYRGKSFDRVMRGVELLNKHDVQWNAMATVNNINIGHPIEFYRFFRNTLNCRFLQFTPIVERLEDNGRLMPGMMEGGAITNMSVTPQQWGRFLCEIFDEWVRNDVGRMFVQIFDATLANWCGVVPGICSLAPTCGHSAALEHNGDLYACDHFVFPDFKLGNIQDNTITEMMYGERQRAFGNMKRSTLPRRCRQCQWLFACNGECPKNRFVRDEHGDFGLNYLCDGYLHFFSHVSPYMDFMARELAEGRAPANVMKWTETTDEQ